MKQTDDQQKKAFVFELLDTMKESGERINADKVARQAQMGKQTILPYYNEWRFLSDTMKQADNDLPADLIRSLQRIMIQWKNDTSLELNHYKQEKKEEIDQLNSSLQELSNKYDQCKLQLAKEKISGEKVIEALEIEKKTVLVKEQELKAQQAKLCSQSDLINSMKEQINVLKSEHATALHIQEEKLDRQHKLQIDHWMSVLDEERQQKQTVLKQHQSLQREFLLKEKEKGSLDNQLEHKSQAYIEVCDERNELLALLSSKKNAIEALDSLKLLMQVEESELIKTVRALLAIEQKYESVTDMVDKKTQEITDLKNTIESTRNQSQKIQTLTMELEKSRGFSMALEQSLNRLQNKEVK